MNRLGFDRDEDVMIDIPVGVAICAFAVVLC